MSSDPEVPLLAATPQRTLKDWASMQIPELQHDGIRVVALVTKDKGAQLAGLVQWRDVSLGAIFTREVTGERSVAGVIEWRF